MMFQRLSDLPHRLLRSPVARVLLFGLLTSAASAQGGTGTVQGTAVRQSDGTPLGGVSVTVRGTRLSAVTGVDGRFTIERVPEGAHVLLFRWFGHRPQEQAVQVAAGGTQTVSAELSAEPITLGEIIVTTASRAPERIVEAPSAIAVVDPAVARATSVTGQVPLALAVTPGVDVVQSGMNDFNINARGFNSTLNRRMLVLQDGRDLAIAFLGAQEWNGISIPLEDLGRIEVVRGPGSALYGANAFSGVIDIRTPTAREVAGSKVTVAGGGLDTRRLDVSTASVFGGGRFGYRFNIGHNRSDTWSRSRTARDTSDFRKEYGEATDEPVRPPTPGFETRPLNGQTAIVAQNYEALGDRDDLINTYGALRVDYYAGRGAVGSVEYGNAQVQNEVFVTGIGRVQVTKTRRPWARVAWAAPSYNLMAWYTGRNTVEPQYSLAAGLGLREESGIYHLEGQVHRSFLDDKARAVLGGSFRQYNLDTDGTLMQPADDNRGDQYQSLYGQVEYKLTPRLRAVLAGRLDNGDLIEAFFSPKGALVFSPNDKHSFRITANQAFQTPNYSEWYLRVPAGAPANFAALEAGLRASALGPALAGVPSGTLFTTSSAVPVLALGNRDLSVEKVNGFEVGYKGNITPKLYVSVDAYLNELSNFVTDLLPGVNPTYGPWTSPTAVPAGFRTALETAVRQQLLAANQPIAAAGLTRLANGNTAIVVSYANAGKVKERGLEFSGGLVLTDELRVEGSYSFFDFDPPEGTLSGDKVLPNTPRHKGTLSVQYTGAQGLDAGLTLRRQTAFDWAAGVLSGLVDWNQTVNLNAGYRLNDNFRVHAIATNLFDQQRFHIYGGSVVGRRVIAGFTAAF